VEKDMKTYVFRVVIEPDEDRWLARVPALEGQGAATWGSTQEEALKNIREVLEMTLESMVEHGEPVPEDLGGEIEVFTEPRVSVTL
jgi:predicted RNase H-like HicB family nuclease